MDLVMAVYAATNGWPGNEQYGLISQVRRAAVAIPSNLAEGHGRTDAREFAHHASIAYGSMCELETQLLIADRLGYIDPDTGRHLSVLTLEVRRFLRGILQSLRANSSPN
jgi:four helix bundle protein